MATELPPQKRDSEAIQILATEHWSLLATRALTYQESIARVTMFLAVLSGAVLALALLAQAAHGPAFVSIAIFMLAVVAVVGFFTVARLIALNRDDYHWVMAMNRIRNAYLRLHPELEPNFFTSPHDDLLGVVRSMGVEPRTGAQGGSVVHGLSTLPGMVSVIEAAVVGAIAGMATAGFGAPVPAIVLLGIAGFVVALGLLVVWQSRDIRSGSAFEARFPTPKAPTS